MSDVINCTKFKTVSGGSHFQHESFSKVRQPLPIISYRDLVKVKNIIGMSLPVRRENSEVGVKAISKGAPEENYFSGHSGAE